MRPIERGPVPVDKDGAGIVYKTYGDARAALIDRMGQYCSYCNQKLPASLAVEHIQPKDPVPALALEWTNFLLGCTNCNSHKGATPVVLTDYIWPDVHNTHLAFQYNDDGTVKINPEITDAALKAKIQHTLDLVGLQRYPDTPTASDRRWKNRKETYQKAQYALILFEQAIQKGAADMAADLIALWAPDSGFFSIWFTAFENHPIVKRALIHAFPGTADIAFDGQMNARKRTAVL